MAKGKTITRRQGRPADNAETAVGRSAILSAATQLVKELPPARVTISLIAREAGVDPALIRYYFGDRSNLLLEVAKAMLGASPPPATGALEPAAAIERNIRRAAHFTNSTKHIHQLMVDELADAKSAEIGRHFGDLNRGAVRQLEDLLARDQGATLRAVDPALLHIALLGLFDFFATAEPVVRSLTPEDMDRKTFASAYEAFVIDLVLNGLRVRP